MPGARLMLKVPAASAAAACTIDASGVARTALAGSALLAMDTGASTTCTSGGSSPSSAAGPNRITRAPCPAAIAAPAATSVGPRSAPLQSTATVTAAGCRGSWDCASGAGATSALLVAVLVLVIVIVRSGHRDLATGVGATDGTHPVRSARAVALGTRVQRGRTDLVLGAPLRGPAVRLLFLGNRHREARRLPARRLPTRASAPSASPNGGRAPARDGDRAPRCSGRPRTPGRVRRSPRGRAPSPAARARMRRGPRPLG